MTPPDPDPSVPAGLTLDTAHGSVVLPTFLPDATRASVRAVDTLDLATVGIQAVMVNAMHLAQRPGLRTVKRAGGLHRFMAWDGVIVSDSGGFQVLSLLRKQGKTAAIRPGGVTFQDSPSAKKIVLTPEKVMEWQFGLGSDVVVALDDCTGPNDSSAEQLASTERTIRWFRQARVAYDLQCRQRRSGQPPLLVGVVQGGTDPELRQRCVDALVESGAQAFGFGGWPLSAEGELERDMFALLARITPQDAPLFALGVGRPEHLVSLCELDTRWVFDCTIPTRDARHGRLYAFVPDIADRLLTPDRSFYQNVYIFDEENSRRDEPIYATCGCPTCQRYSRSYLHHLFRVKDGLANRLATLHNLHFYTRLLDMVRAGQMARPTLRKPARVGDGPVTSPPPAEKVLARLTATAKYRDVHPDTIADLVQREAKATGDAAELERLVRARLHKVAALHLLHAKPAALRRALDRADLDDPQNRRQWCRQVLAGHFSSAERLPDLDVFYPTLLGLVPPPDTVADLACALNPFSLPWLREVSDARYVGYDFNSTFVALGNAFLGRTYPESLVRHEEVLGDGHRVTADLALLLKTYHCMEGRRPGAGLALVDRLECRHVVVSFPIRAMNGRAAVFVPRHVEELTELARDRGWSWSRATLETEHLLVIGKV